jgi:hypothetical protein
MSRKENKDSLRKCLDSQKRERENSVLLWMIGGGLQLSRGLIGMWVRRDGQERNPCYYYI